MKKLFKYSQVTLLFLSLFTFQKKKFISAKEIFQNDFPLRSVDGCSWGDTISLHPYMAISYSTKSECQISDRNNFGLRGPDIPLEKDENFYTVLLVGASLAEQIATYKEYLQPIYLEVLLNENWRSPNGKPFKVLNAAVTGAKQPAILIQSILFSKISDLVASIEGYNEYFGIGGFRLLESPVHAWFNLAAATKNPIKNMVLKSHMSLVRKIHESIFSNSYTVLFLLRSSKAYLQDWVQLEGETTNPFPKPGLDWSAEKREKFYLDNYKRYLEYSNVFMKGTNKPFILFIQPVPSEFKKLTETELQKVGDLKKQIKFKKVKDLLIHMKDQKMDVENLERIFELQTQTIYLDHTTLILKE